jgi:hypothetical protein
MIKQASGYNRSPHQGTYGNVHKEVLRHTFNTSDQDGDVFKLGRFGFDKVYLGFKVYSHSGLGDGVTIDLGIDGIEEACKDGDTEFFCKDITVKAKECTEVCGVWNYADFERDACNPHEPAECAPKWGQLHDLTMKINGTPADGACISVVVEYLHNRL